MYKNILASMDKNVVVPCTSRCTKICNHSSLSASMWLHQPLPRLSWNWAGSYLPGITKPKFMQNKYQWKFVLWLREHKLGLRDNLEGWDGVGGGREFLQERGYMCIYGWSMLMYGWNQHNIVITLQLKINKLRKKPKFSFPNSTRRDFNSIHLSKNKLS